MKKIVFCSWKYMQDRKKNAQNTLNFRKNEQECIEIWMMKPYMIFKSIYQFSYNGIMHCCIAQYSTEEFKKRARVITQNIVTE